MMNKATVEYWKLLNDFEDFVNGSYRRDHGTPPAVRSRVSGSDSSAPETGESLDSIAGEIRSCGACGLSAFRKTPVPGEGNTNPRVLIIGEGPGAQEDESGIPFVGRAGQYLDKWIEAIGLSREQSVFITNVVKCRPPENRDPEEGEMRACFPYLLRQIALLKPEAILCLGRYAGRRISGLETSLSRLRGETYSFEGIPVIVTYHPSAVLRNAELRRPVWDDLQRLKRLLQGES
jgi:uracil-DNA glycosylase